MRGQELDDQEPQSLRDLACRGRHPAFHHHGGDVDSSQVLLELAREVGGVERNARGPDRDTQERDRHLGPTREHDGNPITGADAEAPQRRRHRFHLGRGAARTRAARGQARGARRRLSRGARPR